MADQDKKPVPAPKAKMRNDRVYIAYKVQKSRKKRKQEQEEL